MSYLKVKELKRPSDGLKLEYIEKSPAVACVLFNSDYKQVLLVDQFRAGVNGDLLEIPSGIVDESESYEVAMFREVEEETGYTKSDLDDVRYLGLFNVSPGYTSEKICIYSARVKQGVEPKPLKLDKEEQIIIRWVAIEKIKTITHDMKTVLGVTEALTQPKKRIGVYGGTFNPVTYLHLLTAERAIEDLCLDKIIFEPVGDTYIKEDMIHSTLRLDMLREATCNNDKMECGSYELNSFIQPSTIDTLNFYQEKYGWAEIFFLCGSDILRDMPNWSRTDKLLAQFNVVCVQRNDDNVYKDIILQNKVLLKHKNKIHIIYENVVNDISSSAVRNLVKNNMSIRYLTPDNVIAYIKKLNLYKK